MRNKKLLSTVVASALVATTMAMPVMAAEGDTIDVGVTTKTAVLRVTVPTTLAIAVDQFEMVDAGSQIYSGEFTMENNSAIAVKVGISSTADLKSTTKLLPTKAAAVADTAKAGEAWLAVAAQTAAGSYADGSQSAIADLTEANKNVTTFVQGSDANAAKGTASQTFYLKEASTPKYKLLNKNENASKISYAQFYELTAATVADANELATLIANNDVYVAPGAAADGQALTFVAKGGTHTYASGEVYYTVAATATAKASIDSTKLYVYADDNGTADTNDGKAAFRYIGKLAQVQEEWSKDDITNVHIKYEIAGVTSTNYTKVKPNCVYGLYKAPSAAPSIATKTYTVTANTAFDIPVSLGVGTLAASEVSSVTLKGDSSLELLDGSGTFATYANEKISLTAALATFIVNNPTVTMDVEFDDGTVVEDIAFTVAP